MLHGSVNINNHEIISYKILNTQNQSLESPDLTVYHVWTEGRDIRGYPFEFQFDTAHDREAGAAVLLSNVLLEINRRMNP